MSRSHHVYRFATTRLPIDVPVSVTSNDRPGCGNVMDQDSVQVTLHPRGFDLVCDITSDGAEVSWIVETA